MLHKRNKMSIFVVISTQGPQHEHDWSSGLFECTKDKKSCQFVKFIIFCEMFLVLLDDDTFVHSEEVFKVHKLLLWTGPVLF